MERFTRGWLNATTGTRVITCRRRGNPDVTERPRATDAERMYVDTHTQRTHSRLRARVCVKVKRREIQKPETPFWFSAAWKTGGGDFHSNTLMCCKMLYQQAETHVFFISIYLWYIQFYAPFWSSEGKIRAIKAAMKPKKTSWKKRRREKNPFKRLLN